MKTILVIAAHADDEALGCGGTIARHVAAGDTVHVLFLADGITSRKGMSEKEMERRIAGAESARKVLGISTLTYLGLPDNRLDSMPLLDVVQPIEAVIVNINPQVIYTHHYGDLNVDHRITHQAVMTACRPLPESILKEIYAFEVMSSTEWNTPGRELFSPNLFIDISEYIDTKKKALEAYEFEMRPPPHSRSREHIVCLASHRGCTIGVSYAEAFMIIRIIR